MAFQILSAREKQAVREAIAAVLICPSISPGECHARYGVSFDQMKRILREWPNFDDERDEDVELTIHGTLNEVCNGIAFGDDPDIRGMTEEEWPKWFSVSRDDLRLIFQRWRELSRQKEEKRGAGADPG